MRIAAALMEKGINFSRIVDQSYYQKTYVQNQIMGRTLMESIMLMEGRCIVGIVRLKEMKFYGLNPSDMDGIVAQLRKYHRRGSGDFPVRAEAAVFQGQPALQRNRGRQPDRRGVPAAAAMSGAAGFNMRGTPYDVINNITPYVEEQLEEYHEANERNS